MTANSIPVTPARKCPWCGESGPIVLVSCRDYLCGLPGEWSFRECRNCFSLWLDPRPTPDSVPALYPGNYRLTKATISSGTGIDGLKAAILRRCYGYPLVASKAQTLLAMAASFARGLRRKAGYSVRYLSAIPTGRLLDVGCGNGAFLSRMRRLGWKVDGIEPDSAAAAIGRSHGLSVQVGSIAEAELPECYYDAITMTHVAEHLSDPANDLRKVVRALKSGGAFVSISPNPKGILRRYFGRNWYELDPPRHLSLPSETGYRLALTKLGCSVTTWTNMRLAYWATKESLSIKCHGEVGVGGSEFTVTILSSLLSILAPLLAHSGEEVICYARRR